MPIEYEIANDPEDPEDPGDGKGFHFLIKGFDPTLPAEHDAGSAHGKSVPLYITGTWATKAGLEALLKVQMDKAPIVGKDDDDNDVLGKTPREVLAAWIAKQIAILPVTKAILPTKNVTETDEEGNKTSHEVTDRKVTL